MRRILVPIVLLALVGLPSSAAAGPTRAKARAKARPTAAQIRMMRARVEALALVKQSYGPSAEVHVRRSALEAKRYRRWNDGRLDALERIFGEQETERRKRLRKGTKHAESVADVVGKRLELAMKEILRRARVDKSAVTSRYARAYRDHVNRKNGIQSQIYRAEREVAKSEGAKLREAEARLAMLKKKLEAIEEAWKIRIASVEKKLSNHPQYLLMKLWDQMNAQLAKRPVKRRAG